MDKIKFLHTFGETRVLYKADIQKSGFGYKSSPMSA